MAYSFTILPGVSPTGINDSGQVVGHYPSFLYNNGVYTTLRAETSDPSVSFTQANQINDLGQIVGYVSLVDADGFADGIEGFVYNSGAYTRIDDPSVLPDTSANTSANGINDFGQIVGNYYVYDPNLTYYAFLYSGGSFTHLNVPSATASSATDINNVGQIVGFYADAAGHSHGFLYSGGGFTTLDNPQGMDSVALGINNLGQIVGSYTDAGGVSHGWVYNNGTYTNFDYFPDITPYDINDSGQIVGVYSDSRLEGFIATPLSASLFTTGAETVNFNSLSTDQEAAISSGADLYNGLGGGDNITLPTANPGDTSILIPGTSKSFDLTHPFILGDKAGDTTAVTGGNGSYNIALGAGTANVTIKGLGTSTLTAGTGTDNLSISGGGTLIVKGNLVSGTAMIGANSILELTGSYSGVINFSGTGGILRIDGTTMPTGVVTGFNPDDTIDLKGVVFDSRGATVLQTSNNSIQPNNVLHVFANGQDYKLRLDPSQSITGGFQLYPDGSGGTKISLVSSPVSGGQTTPFYSTSVYPYMAVVDIETATGHGTGFIIGPHSILTAAHVVESSSGQIFGNIKIYPGSGGTNQPTGSPISVNSANVHPGAYALFASSTDPATQYDWAVLNISADLSAYGRFQILPDYSGGTVNITGYPGFPQTNGIVSVAPASAPDGFGQVFAENPNITVQGYSGGPLWIYDGSVARAVGLVSGAFDVRLTSDDWADIQSFMSLPIVTGQISGKLVHGYIFGATIFSDDNNNGQLDPSEASTTTDTLGGFTLFDASSPLVAFGGTDTSTGLAFKGQLSAPSGSSVITPLTTLMALLATDPLAEQKVLTSFGLSSSIDLNTFDPIATTQAGSADGAATTAAVAKVYDTVSLIASTLVAAGGEFSSGVKEAFAAIAAAIGGSGISLANEAQVSALVVIAAQADGVTLGQGVADSVAAIIVATNTLLDQKAQSGATGDELLNAIAAIERVVQGTASNAIQHAGNDPAQLQALVGAFSGENLDDAVSAALEHLGVADTTAPTFTPVADQTNEATSAAGVTAFFAATANDNVDGTVPVVFKEGNAVVHSGDVFGLGNHTITASAFDAAGNTATDTFEINVVDTTGPTLTPIADQVFEATSASGAAAFFAATATDAVDGTDPVVFKEGNTIVHSGDVFSFGPHTVTATAVDAAGNQTSQNFKFNVVDTTAPTLTSVANQTNEATSAAGAAAFFTAAATDAVDGTDVVVFKGGNNVVHSGDIFSLGSHTITASTTDAAGNLASETFTINVKDTTAPTLTPIADQTLQAATAAGTAAFFTTTASDLVDGTDPVTFMEGNKVIHSGDIFGVGVHTITASAVDTAGNSATDVFEINVLGPASHNHDPAARFDSNGVAKGKNVSVSANKGVLANDRDADHDHLSVGSVNGSAANVGHSIKGDYGTLTLNADGSYSYAAIAKALPSQIFAQDTFTYTTVDGYGGSDTSTLTFSVFDPSSTYKSGSNTILWGDNGKSVLDGSGGHVVAYGGKGADVLIGGKGDILAGGKGPDQFVFRPEFGANTILDFDVKNDHLQFDDSIFNSVKSILDHTTNTALGAVLSDGHGDSVLLLGVSKFQLLAHSSDLLIA
ncbi:HYR domain-containing protein [Bradyrhizobium japonicum]|uniref:HYR domain-containing protein n=1 Tax=Bradyrhizobium japonicum TaxID=375 RepID=UPI002646BD30|nr:HYR domain-containing protein [Bradyrhizobium japonicum]MCP1774742.1 putative HAF family extracellular repeat protein/VCBS repeat-containing protein [Bradyrhizobium japonicum]MCP1962258.1 putative HAF family extracellular repeat protein/VCBS repeat-containing protein [Bradyrhizobium japonicum]